MKIWRISNFADLSGLGGKLSAGRWNHLGSEIVYCSDHPATCLLELLVRFNPEYTPSTFQLLEISLEENHPVFEPILPEDWMEDPVHTRDIWSDFCKNGIEGVMKVPSVIMPQASHYLLNSAHRDHRRIAVTNVYANILDKRFYGE